MEQNLTHETETATRLDALVRSVVAGAREDFRLLVEATHTPLARIIARHIPYADQAEVLQDAYIRAFKSLPSFRFESPVLHWLTVIAVRTCHDYWRKQSRMTKFEIVDSDVQLTAEDDSIDRKDEDLLEAVLSALSPTDRMVLCLLYLEERSVKEVAHLLGISKVAVKVRALRARRRAAILLGRM